MQEAKRLKIIASSWMLGGTVGVLLFIVAMNNYNTIKKKDKEADKTIIRMDKVVKTPPPPKAKVEQAKAPSRATAAPAMSNLGSAIAGVDFGLPSLGGGGLDDGSLLGDTSNVVMTDATVDVPPKPTTRVAPEYPRDARAKGLTGYVSFNLLINPNGDIERIQILESVPSGMFDSAAQAAISNWRFQPAQYKGASVKVWAKQTIKFQLGA